MSSAPRVCIIGNAQSVHVQRWARGLAAKGWAVTVFGPFGISDTAFESIAWSSNAGGPLSQLLALPSQFAEQRRVLNASRFDLMWLHGVDQGRRMRLLPRDIPLVSTVYGSDVIPPDGSPSEAPPAQETARVLERSAMITAASDYLADFASRRFAMRRERFVVVPFGVDTDLFAPRDMGPHDVPTILYVKGAKPIYGLEVLIRAAALLSDSGTDIRIRIAGAGDFGPYIVLAESLGVRAGTDVLGCLDERQVADALADSDILAMPSLVRESFGVAAVEAMAAGVPVIASRIGAIPEVIDEGRDGLLVPPGDPESLADAIRRLIGDPQLRHRMGVAGRRTACERYDWQFCLGQMDGLLRSAILGSKSEGRVRRA